MYRTALMKLKLKNLVQYVFELGASEDCKNKLLFCKKFSRIMNVFDNQVQFSDTLEQGYELDY